MDILPFHDSFRSPVTVETSELALVLLDGGGHAVGEVLPAVRDHVPGVGTVRVEDKPMVKGVSTKFCGNFHNISRKLLLPLLLVKVPFRSMWTSILISGRDHGLSVEIQSRVSTFVYKNIFLSLIVKMLVIFRKFREILLTPSGE